LDLEVGPDQIVRLPGTGNFAGSALRPVAGVFRAAEMLRGAWPAAWGRFSEGPARLMGLDAGLAVGRPADFCLLRVSETGQAEDLRVFVRGQESPARPRSPAAR
jgi:N-acetylglucosamine-6-phosphate deacetylase